MEIKFWLSLSTNSAEILVLGPLLCTRIWVLATIGLLEKPLSNCQSGQREIQNAVLVIIESVGGPEQVHQRYFTDVTNWG